MKSWTWKPEKNETLKKMGRPSFEDIVDSLDAGGFRDVLGNPNYPDQYLLVVMVDGYIHVVPFKINQEIFFLFTAYPSRTLQKRYGGNKK